MPDRASLCFRSLCLWIALAGATSSVVEAQVLWQGAKFGMSPDQVSGEFPGAAAADSAPQRLANGATELLRMRHVGFARENFTVHFYFQKRTLHQVTLSLDRKVSFDAILPVFESLSQALRSKHGAEASRDVQRGALNIAKSRWRSGRTTIDLFALAVGEHDAFLNLNHRALGRP